MSLPLDDALHYSLPMLLPPRDKDKLLLHLAGTLAQKRLARGLRLNLPEATALLATVLLERIRDGASVATLMDEGRRILGLRHVLPGVATMLHEVQVEGTFPDGTKLVTVHDPIATADGDLARALYGSFLPVPEASLFPEVSDDDAPGAVRFAVGEIVLNADRDAITLEVESVGDRPIQVGSHYPFEATNPALKFDRAAAAGRRLDVPAGTAIRFEAGEKKTVRLVTKGPKGATR